MVDMGDDRKIADKATIVCKHFYQKIFQGIHKLVFAHFLTSRFREAFDDFIIPETVPKLKFGCGSSAANFLSSLAPCARTMVAHSRQKLYAAPYRISILAPFLVYFFAN